MRGTLLNSLLILAGSLLGLAMHRRLARTTADTILQAIGLFVLYVGADMVGQLQHAQKPLAALVCLAAGTWVGAVLRIEDRLQSLGRWAEARFGGTEAGSGRFARGLVSASLLFAVGPMAILGSIQDGTTGDYRILLTKGMMDGIASVAFASTLGPGVAVSSAVVFVYQGLIAAGAGVLAGLFTPPAIALLSGTGGLLIVGLGLNLVGATRLPVANMLPSLLFALLVPLLPLP